MLRILTRLLTPLGLFGAALVLAPAGDRTASVEGAGVQSAPSRDAPKAPPTASAVAVRQAQLPRHGAPPIVALLANCSPSLSFSFRIAVILTGDSAPSCAWPTGLGYFPTGPPIVG